jgi:hypothetical protein
LTTEQQKAALAVLEVALSSDGYQQDVNIEKADDYLNSLSGQGADDFGSVKDYHIALYGQPSPTHRSWSSSAPTTWPATSTPQSARRARASGPSWLRLGSPNAPG